MRVAAAASALSYAPEPWDALIRALGGDTVTATVNDLFGTTLKELSDAIMALEAGGNALTAIPRGRFIREVQRLAAFCGLRVPDFGTAAPPPELSSLVGGSAGVGSTPQAPGPGKRKFNEVLVDGPDEGEFCILPAPTIRQINKEFREMNGDDPEVAEDPTDEQLSGLAALLAEDRVPYVDLKIFRPFGKRLQRLLRYRAQVFVDGVLVSRQLSGPPPLSICAGGGGCSGRQC